MACIGSQDGTTEARALFCDAQCKEGPRVAGANTTADPRPLFFFCESVYEDIY